MIPRYELCMHAMLEQEAEGQRPSGLLFHGVIVGVELQFPRFENDCCHVVYDLRTQEGTIKTRRIPVHETVCVTI